MVEFADGVRVVRVAAGAYPALSPALDKLVNAAQGGDGLDDDVLASSDFTGARLLLFAPLVASSRVRVLRHQQSRRFGKRTPARHRRVVGIRD